MEEIQVLAPGKNGDSDSFTRIVDLYHEPVKRYLYRLTGDYEIAGDLTQDTFLQAYQNISKTDGNLPLKNWLYRIATNNAWQYRRRQRLATIFTFKKSRELHDLGDASSNDENMVIQETLLKIPADQRTCLVLRFIEGFKSSEIAATLGISDAAVRTRVARGKKAFIKIYNPEGGIRK